jgi:alkylmercury lyase
MVIDELANRLNRLGVGSLEPTMAQLAVSLLRELAKGRPITLERAIEIEAKHGVGAQVIETARSQFSQLDDEGNIVGFVGLTLSPTPHRFVVGDRDLYTWCTLDGLFLTPLLGAEARIETTSPSGNPVKVELSPSGIKSVNPESSVLSIVLPENRSGTQTAADIRSGFCAYVHFFACEDEFLNWRPDDRELVGISVRDGFELGKRLNGNIVVPGSQEAAV